MKNKDLVKGMVSIAAGGLSMYESYLISIEKNDIPDFWKDAYSYSIGIYKNLEDYSESIETTPLGLVYRQMVSFMDLRPFDYYKNINIPVLFIHGNKDMNIAVESTMYIQKNLPDKPFEYIYYDMGHIPMEEFEKIKFRKDIAKWIRKINKK
jgi:dipeptidyl aminopeptidase/acylaminoacyl peptidase